MYYLANILYLALSHYKNAIFEHFENWYLQKDKHSDILMGVFKQRWYAVCLCKYVHMEPLLDLPE